MTEQTPQDEAREGAKQKHEPRDAAYWAQYAETLKVAGVAEGATNINVEGRRAVGPLQGFGKLLQKTCKVSLTDTGVRPSRSSRLRKRITRTSGPRGTASTRRLRASRPARSPSSAARCLAASSSRRA